MGRPVAWMGLLVCVSVVLRPASLQGQSTFRVGDVNQDGLITSLDALAVLSHVVGVQVPETFNVDPGGDALCRGNMTEPDSLITIGSDTPVHDYRTPKVTAGDALVILTSIVGGAIPADACLGLEVDTAWQPSWGAFLASGDTGPSQDTLNVPEAFRASVQVDMAAGSGAPFNAEVAAYPARGLVRFESADPDVAAITEMWELTSSEVRPVLTPRAVGETDLVVRWFGQADTIRIVVTPWEPTVLSMSLPVVNTVDSLSYSEYLAVGDTGSLRFSIRDDRSFLRPLPIDSVAVVSANPGVLDLSPEGRVTALQTGVGVIAASSANLSASLTRTVQPDEFFIEAALKRVYERWWVVNHRGYPGAILSVMADDHSSSWGNWGMRDGGEEPRKALINEPDYDYRGAFEVPWEELHRTLYSLRRALVALDQGTLAASDPGLAHLYRTYAKLVQGLTYGTLAQLFDQAILISEDVAPDYTSFVPYPFMLNAALSALDETIQLAQTRPVQIPSAWVGFNGDWDNQYIVGVANGFKARFRASVPRTPAERASVNWSLVLGEASNAHASDVAAYHDGSNWAWGREKLHTGSIDGWMRTDMRTLGPADASGAYASWLAAPPNERQPFNIETLDSRVTGQTDTDGDGVLWDEHGSYIAYLGTSPFPASRGTYHYSHYKDDRWSTLSQSSSYVGTYIDFPLKELDFLRAEAMYRIGDFLAARVIVNQSRENGGLPPVADFGVAPGGDRCVPKPDGVNCGDLWEALKYEKRIELFHYGLGTAYFDDRGWGDLVEGTAVQFPVPAKVLLELGLPVYTYGGPEAAAAPTLITGVNVAPYLERLSGRSFEAREPVAPAMLVTKRR